MTIDPIHLQTFRAVARLRSFSAAARELGLGQPTVSQHIARLERSVARRLFVRDTHSVRLTPDGEAMEGFARTIMEAQDRAIAHFATARLRGRIRFGASEDLVFSRLTDMLRQFRHAHPLVDIELTVGLSGWLAQKFEAGELDLVLAKRHQGSGAGRLLWRDQLRWIGAPGTVIDPGQPVPLILYPPPSVTRAIVLEALDQAGRPWRIACTSGSLTGLRAAALAEIGILPIASRLIPDGLTELADTTLLPKLDRVDFVLLERHGGDRAPAAQLASTILAAVEGLRDRAVASGWLGKEGRGSAPNPARDRGPWTLMDEEKGERG